MELLTERYKPEIKGVLSCFDRIVITGTLPTLCYAEGMGGYLNSQKIRLFDYAKFCEPFRLAITKNAEQVAQQNGLNIEFVRSSKSRKEDIVSKHLAQRGTQAGLVCILSAMESCHSYRPNYNPKTGRTTLKPVDGKCLHYYFYLIDEELGLCYLRVPTWCPFRLQAYFNGHNWLATHLQKAGIRYEVHDNAFVDIEDFTRAQALADSLPVKALHGRLDLFAQLYCGVHADFGQHYHWSIMQAEYATDIVFKEQKALQPIYSELTATAIHTVKADNIATFLSKKPLHGKSQQEADSRYCVRIEGTCIKHRLGSNSIKMYDKFAHVLRIETTSSDITFFKHYRKVEHKDGTSEMKQAAMQKTIYSLDPLRECLAPANRRYLEFVSAIDDKKVGREKLQKVSRPHVEGEHTYKGFNFFDEKDESLLLSIARGEFCVSGLRNKHLQPLLGWSSWKISQCLKRLRMHGLIKKIGHAYKYYLTDFGKEVICMAQKVKELVIIPQLNLNQALA